MRMAPMIMILFVIYITIGVSHQTIDNSGNAYGNGGESFIFNAILQPWNWSGETGGIPNFLLILGSLFVGAVGIAAGVSLISKSDLSSLAPMFLVFVAIGAPPIISFYNFVTSNVGVYVCTVGEACGPANLLGALTAGILAIYWIFVCIQWWTWRETT